jgi:RHS repeat-associated protein
MMLGGNPTPASPATTKLLYAGEQFDPSLGHYYLRARYYNPSNGRFNQTDPFAGNPSDPQSLHKYLYCHNDPINNIDPSGMFAIASLAVSTMIGQLVHNIYDGVVMTVYSAMQISINAAQNHYTMTQAMMMFVIGTVLMPLLIWGAIAGIGRIFGPTAAKWAGRFVDFAQLFSLILSHPNYVDDLPELQSGRTNTLRNQLRDNLSSASGRHRSVDMSNARAHHIIPWEFRGHPVISGLNVDLNHPSNGIFLHKEHHVGGHPDYIWAMSLELDRIERLPRSQWRPEVIKLRNNTGTALYHGAPLLQKHGSRPAVWRNIMRGN